MARFVSTEPTVTTKPKRRVLVIDDHVLVREGLAELIRREDDLICCGKAASIREALGVAAASRPHLALVDLMLGSDDGMELVRMLKIKFPEIRILVISQLEETGYAERALRAGAAGYISKDRATEELLVAMRSILEGKNHVSEMVAKLMSRSNSGSPTSASRSLSQQELIVFEQLALGKRDEEIAAQLEMSSRSVGLYRERIRQKLGLPSPSDSLQHASKWIQDQKNLSPDLSHPVPVPVAYTSHRPHP